MTLKGRRASGGEPGANAATTLPHGSVDLNVSSLLDAHVAAIAAHRARIALFDGASHGYCQRGQLGRVSSWSTGA
jgi:hypothetical protein